MNQADEYVKAFVKDVNRAKVGKAKIIMTTSKQFKGKDKTNNRIKVNEDQFLEEFLSKIVCSDTTVEVVDKKGDVKGYITNKEMETSLTKS